MTLHQSLDAFYAFLDRPIHLRSRLVLAALVIPLILSFVWPLWRISMVAPQYPNGLYMDVYVHKVDGGHEGHDITEINELNHYIGMKPIDKAALTDLDWMPFAIGLLVILTLRTAAVGTVRSLVDLTVMSGYVSLFAFARFVYRLWYFGHSLAPDAPIRLKPFTPAILGEKQVANFSTASWPHAAAYCVAVYLVGVVSILVYHLVVGRRTATRAIGARGSCDASPLPRGLQQIGS